MAKSRGKFADMNPVERSIFRRESGIARMRENIKRIRERAEEAVAEIEARIREKQVLLDALKRGNLKV
jgi:hypothetical protein